MQDSTQATSASCAPEPLSQFPVDTRITIVTFIVDTIDFVRIVVTNQQTTARCALGMEYYYADQRVSIDHVDALTMSSGKLRPDQEAVDAFAGGMPAMFAVPQKATWHRGVHTPTGDRRRLYRAPDPDDATRMLGLLLEQDTRGRLTRITWYKAKETTVIFGHTPPTLRFELVRDAAGAPSTDPNDIGAWAWSYATDPAP